MSDMEPGLAAPRAQHRLTTRERVVKLLRAARLNRAAARFYYRFIHGFASEGRALPDVVRRSLCRAAESGTAAEGDYYEFGVFKGHTFLQAHLATRELGLDGMRCFGFDSFEGLPPVEGVDRTAEEHFYEGQYACSLERVRAELDRHAVDWNRCFLIKGFFQDTLTDEARAAYGMRKASVVLLDSDLYESAAVVLAFLAGMLADGTILIMDDWNTFDRDDSRGERRALGEFLRAHPEWSADPWFHYPTYGQVFIMRRSS
jgi:O-methyltransferase